MTFDDWFFGRLDSDYRATQIMEDICITNVMLAKASCLHIEKRVLFWLEQAYNAGKASSNTSQQEG